MAGGCRAVAAGMINSEITSNIPTTFMPTAITAAIKSVNKIFIVAVATPSTRAKSSLTVDANMGRQKHKPPPTTRITRPKMTNKSVSFNAKISPNR